jgi:hypothetical protein
LSYNLKGGVSLKEEEGMNILDVSFHDTLADSRRVAPYRDYHSLSMAALGDRVRTPFGIISWHDSGHLVWRFSGCSLVWEGYPGRGRGE